MPLGEAFAEESEDAGLAQEVGFIGSSVAAEFPGLAIPAGDGVLSPADGRVGASPDQLIGEDGCLEIKCPSPEIHMMYLMQAGGAYTAYKVQCQTHLFVSKRYWGDVVSYFPGLPEAIIRIERDERFIARIETASREFCDELDAKWAECKARGWGAASEALKDSRFKHLPALDELLKLAGVP